jgi:uncharacterized membrane protein YcjF (UPF0283 family)
MKPTLRDYLSITAALLAILLCGYGIGFLVGERTTRLRLTATPPASQEQADWATATTERLTRQLTLSTAQQTAVASEIRLAATGITATRHQAIRAYRMALIDLHQRLLPHLDSHQRKQVEESQKQLQLSIDKDIETATHTFH